MYSLKVTQIYSNIPGEHAFDPIVRLIEGNEIKNFVVHWYGGQSSDDTVKFPGHSRDHFICGTEQLRLDPNSRHKRQDKGPRDTPKC